MGQTRRHLRSWNVWGALRLRGRQVVLEDQIHSPLVDSWGCCWAPVFCRDYGTV